MKKILLLLSLAAPLCASSKIADKIHRARDTKEVLALWVTDAKTHEQQEAYFATIFEAYPWETFSTEQQRELSKFWIAMNPKSRDAARKWLPKDTAAKLDRTPPPLPPLPPKKHTHHQHHPHHGVVPPPGSEKDIKGSEFDTKHTHGAPKSKPQPKKSAASAASASSALPLAVRVDGGAVVYAPADGDAHEFQMSVKSPQQLTDKVVFPGTIGLLSGFPAIGVYTSERYFFRPRLALIELGPQHVKQVADIIGQKIEAKKIDVHVVINGLLHEGKVDRVNNLVFHAWTANIEGGDRFSVNVPMGIFLANGVKAAADSPVSVNSLQAASVNPHDGTHLSPNNARFEIIEGRRVVTFWSMAQYKDQATVTFHVIINDPKLVDLLKVCLSDALTSDELVGCLVNLADKGIGKVGEDRSALEGATAIIGLLLAA